MKCLLGTNRFIYLFFYFLVKWVPGQGPEQRETGKTVLYLLIVIIILISYIIIKLALKGEPSQQKPETELVVYLF
jgi:hypothetical protein